MCDIGGDERADVWDQVPRVARKQHRCDGCGCSIRPGEHYAVTTTFFEGSWDRAKTCFVCWWITEDFGLAHNFFPHPTSLRETLTECVDEREPGGARWRLAQRMMDRQRAVSP